MRGSLLLSCLFLASSPSLGCIASDSSDDSDLDRTGPTRPSLDPAADDPPSPPTTPSPYLLQEFQQCMTLGDFQTANMAPEWSAVAAQNQQQCGTCHGPAVFSPDAETFFGALKSSSAAMTIFFAVDATAGKVVVNDTGLARVSAGTPPHTEHPRFSIQAGPMSALEQFYALTRARIEAGTCP